MEAGQGPRPGDPREGGLLSDRALSFLRLLGQWELRHLPSAHSILHKVLPDWPEVRGFYCTQALTAARRVLSSTISRAQCTWQLGWETPRPSQPECPECILSYQPCSPSGDPKHSGTHPRSLGIPTPLRTETSVSSPTGLVLLLAGLPALSVAHNHSPNPEVLKSANEITFPF